MMTTVITGDTSLHVSIALPEQQMLPVPPQQQHQPIVADGEYHQLIQQSLQDDLNDVVIVPSDTQNNTSLLGASVSATSPTNIVYDENSNTDGNNPTEWYGSPLSIQDVQEQILYEDSFSATTGPEGLIWNIVIIPNEMLVTIPISAPSSKRPFRHGLNHRDFVSTVTSNTKQVTVHGKSLEGRKDEPLHQQQEQARQIESSDKLIVTQQLHIKPRRPSLPISVCDFVSSLTKIESNSNDVYRSGATSRYFFYGILNGWYGLHVPMEVLSIEFRRSSSMNNVLPTPKEILTGQIVWVKAWTSPGNRSDSKKDTINYGALDLLPNRVYRAKLRAPKWTSIGWTKENPGFVFWYEPYCNCTASPKVTFGTNMLTDLSSYPNSNCTQIHMISHRYAVGNRVETPRDRLTYHSICLLEWDHGMYCTVIETAYLNGMGGYQCKSNWYDDKLAEPKNKLYQSFPKQMICPWIMTQSEIRCYDVPAKNLNEFLTFMSKYENQPSSNINRFIDVQCTFTHAARLTFRNKANIAQYLLNYILRDTSYNDLKRNCQTFSADLCCLIAGKKNVVPFHPINRIEYSNRTYMFLYDSHLYDKKKKANKK